jgi:hypothetical protein
LVVLRAVRGWDRQEDAFKLSRIAKCPGQSGKLSKIGKEATRQD